MNKQRFIERLNLHLDGELSEEESNELLSEIRENPEYHRIYVQYCQLFNACSALGSRFVESKPAGAFRQKAYAIGGMAAAFALMFLAAKNLTPLLDGFVGTSSDGVAANTIPSQALGNDPSEALLVLGSPSLDDAEVSPNNNQTIPARLDSFNRSQMLDFGSNADVTFAHLINNERSKRTPHLQERRDFLLSEPASESTFAHEAIATEEGIAGYPYSISPASESSFGDGESLPVKYEYERSAAVATPKN